MPLVDKEKIRNYAMQKSMEMMQNPKVMKVMQNPKVMNAMMKAFEHRNKTKAKIDARVNKMAKSFNLVVQNEMTETNHSVRTLTNTVKELTETVEELQKQIKKSALSAFRFGGLSTQVNAVSGCTCYCLLLEQRMTCTR